jgi:hypothetical protein
MNVRALSPCGRLINILIFLYTSTSPVIRCWVDRGRRYVDDTFVDPRIIAVIIHDFHLLLFFSRSQSFVFIRIRSLAVIRMVGFGGARQALQVGHALRVIRIILASIILRIRLPYWGFHILKRRHVVVFMMRNW